MLTFDSDNQSIAFGRTGTHLENLLFVTHDDAPNTPPGTVATTPSALTMVDITTLQQVDVAQGGTRGFDVLTTADGRVLISQSHEVDVLEPVVPPSVASVNPPPGVIVALPLGVIDVVFDQNMYKGPANDPTSVTNPANYTLAGPLGGSATILSVRYNPNTHTALLFVSGLTADQYTLTVSDTIVGTNGLAMTSPYVSTFTAISDLSPYVKLTFVDTRSDRNTGTVSYDVSIENTSQFNLLVPIFLILDPRRASAGRPKARRRTPPEAGCSA